VHDEACLAAAQCHVAASDLGDASTQQVQPVMLHAIIVMPV
jgi:hypothetical protein